MTKTTKGMLYDLIEAITIENHCEGILDDMYPDMIADHEGESIQELVDYIDREYDIRSEV